jgi:predicted enzyme related to lactoylglutathione lyase
MKIRGIDFIFYNVTDMKRSVAFYRDILGLKVYGEVGDMWTEFDVGNNTLVIGVYGATPVKDGEKGPVSVGLSVDNVEKALEYLKGKGVKINMPLQDFPPCHMASISDPDGNEIMLHNRKDGTVG